MTQTVLRPLPPADDQHEALIREARRLRRRRWAISGLVVALVCLTAGVANAILNGGNQTSSPRTTGFDAGAPRAGALTTLHLAGALAVSQSGNLYIADAPDGQQASSRVNADRVLVRTSNGRFRVVVSDLPYISSLAVAPDGTLYIADAGWVRKLGRNGMIRTIAGDGRAPGYDRRTGQLPIATNLPALNAPLGSIRSTEVAYRSSPLHIATGPSGDLYISNGDQVLRLTGRGILQPVKASMTPTAGLPGGQLTETAQFAVAPNGTIYASGMMRGWSLWEIKAGTARYLSYARQNGGDTVAVVSGPHGTVYAADGDEILLINRGATRAAFEFRHDVAGQYFWLTNFVITANGVIYADEIGGGGGFEAHQQLVAVRERHVTLLWQEANRAPR